MIDPDTAINIVTTVGFPIAVTGFLLWERMTDRVRQTQELKNQHEQTRQVLETNTRVTNELCIMLKTKYPDVT